MLPADRKLRILELALVLSAAFLLSTVYSVHDWWLGAKAVQAVPEDPLGDLNRLLNAGISIALLAYVLRRQGKSLAEIGLTLRLSDFLWFFPLWFASEIARSTLGLFVTRPAIIHPSIGLISWLAVVPAAAKEELIVRAFLITEVSELTGRMGWAVVASVGLQTLYHLYQGLPSALFAASAFLVCAVFYAGTRRITPVILVHAVYNFKILSWWTSHPG